MNTANQIRHNIKCHDKIAAAYEHIHGDIFNPVEQERVRLYLKRAVDSIQTESARKVALDYGCGSGNLTKHLIDFGVFTVAADISRAFLSQVKTKFSHTRLIDVMEINGHDLSGISDTSIDIAATYSVLHHVPDYVAILREMIRVVKPGGIIYIDQEPCASFWHGDRTVYNAFQEAVRATLPAARRNWKLFLQLSYYVTKFKLLLNPRYTVEGDLHVWPDDHVETDEIKSLLTQNNFEVLVSDEYLFYRKHYPRDIYKKYQNLCNDRCVLIARKKQGAPV